MFSPFSFHRPVSVFAFVSLFFAGDVRAQLVINQTQSPNVLVQNIMVGQDVIPSAVSFNSSSGTVVATVGDGPGEIGRFNGTNTMLGLDGGLFLCTNVATAHLPGPNDQLMVNGGGIGAPAGIQTPDQDLCRLSGYEFCDIGNNIYNKAVVEFDFVPLNDMVSFRYVFSSEEYERWACSEYNDTFGWFISGPGISGPYSNNAMNIAIVPGSLDPVCINSVNSGMIDVNANGPDVFFAPYGPCQEYANWLGNTQYYRYNGGQWPTPQPIADAAQLEAPYNNDPAYIAHNGMTAVLTASAAVQIGQTYHMKMGVANVSDSKYPSAVFIEGSSFRASDRFTMTVDEGANVNLGGDTPIVYQSGSDQVTLRINRWGGFYLDEDVQITVEGDAVAGVDYQPELPTLAHFDQLDSAVTITISVPLEGNAPRELIVNLITSEKEQSFSVIVADESTVDVHPMETPVVELGVFPQPATHAVQVSLPSGMSGNGELQLLDMAGRVVRTQRITGTTTMIAVDDLPDGLYSLRALVNGRVATARVNVRH